MSSLDSDPPRRSIDLVYFLCLRKCCYLQHGHCLHCKLLWRHSDFDVGEMRRGGFRLALRGDMPFNFQWDRNPESRVQLSVYLTGWMELDGKPYRAQWAYLETSTLLAPWATRFDKSWDIDMCIMAVVFKRPCIVITIVRSNVYWERLRRSCYLVLTVVSVIGNSLPGIVYHGELRILSSENTIHKPP